MRADWLQLETVACERAALPVRLLGERIWLLPQRALFWEKERLLVVSDAHFGKVGAFREGGIALPQGTGENDLGRLREVLAKWEPRECLFLGDLFHSRQNKEWDLLAEFFRGLPEVLFSLVEGNHDILPVEVFREGGLFLHGLSYAVGPFCFSHDRLKEAGGYNIHGHIHPGARLRGPGRDELQLPAFVFRQDHAILPAFGEFTGSVAMRRDPGGMVFVTTGESIQPIDSR